MFWIEELISNKSMKKKLITKFSQKQNTQITKIVVFQHPKDVNYSFHSTM
jgi:hypothetical protein